MSFKFLPFKQIEENLVALIAKLFEEHEKTKSQINEKRQAQLDTLDNLFAQLRALTAVVGREALKKSIESNLRQLNDKIATQPLNEEQLVLKHQLEDVKPLSEEQLIQRKKIAEQEAQLELKKKLADVKALSEEQISRLKTLRAAAKPLNDQDEEELRNLEVLEYQNEQKKKVADVKELSEEQRKLIELEERNAKKKELADIELTVINKKRYEQERAALLKFQEELEKSYENENDEDQKAKEEREAREVRVLTDEQRAIIATGVLLNIKSEIKKEYEGLSNALIGLVKTNKPENSILYSGIDGVIGVTAENKLDEKSEIEARNAAAQFVDSVKLVSKFDKSRLKKVPSSVIEKERLASEALQKQLREIESMQKDARNTKPIPTVKSDPKLVLKDLTSPELLKPSKSLLEQAQDRRMDVKKKKMVTEQIASYTPDSEVGRYIRDEKSRSSYVQVHHFINPKIEDVGITAGVVQTSDEVSSEDQFQANAVAEFRAAMLQNVDRPVEPTLGTVRELNEEEAKVYKHESELLKLAIMTAEKKLQDKAYKDEKEKAEIEQKLKEDKAAYELYLQSIKAFMKEKNTWTGVKDPSDKEADHFDGYKHEFETVMITEYRKKQVSRQVEVQAVTSTRLEADEYYSGLRTDPSMYVGNRVKTEQLEKKNAELTNEVLLKERVSIMGVFGMAHEKIRKSKRVEMDVKVDNRSVVAPVEHATFRMKK